MQPSVLWSYEDQGWRALLRRILSVHWISLVCIQSWSILLAYPSSTHVMECMLWASRLCLVGKNIRWDAIHGVQQSPCSIRGEMQLENHRNFSMGFAPPWKKMWSHEFNERSRENLFTMVTVAGASQGLPNGFLFLCQFMGMSYGPIPHFSQWAESIGNYSIKRWIIKFPPLSWEEFHADLWNGARNCPESYTSMKDTGSGNTLIVIKIETSTACDDQNRSIVFRWSILHTRYLFKIIKR